MRGTTKSILPARHRPGMASRGVVVALAVVVVTAFAIASAGAAPTTTSTTTPETGYAGAMAQALTLNLQIAANSKRADVLDERYLNARRAVAGAKRRIAATQAQIAAIEAHAQKVRDRLAGRAALLYMGIGNADPIGVDVANVQDMGAMAQYGDAAAAQDQRLVDDLQRSDDELSSRRDALRDDLAAAQDRQHDAESARRKVEDANAAMMKLLDSTNSDVKLLATEIEQKAQAAAAVAEQAWLKKYAAEQAAARKHHPPGSGTLPDPAAGFPSPDLKPPVPGALLAVAYARAQLGKPYIYAAAGPEAFDCSGLTMMAWAQSGVSMVHGSQAQWAAFPKVAIEDLQPGDLVFFGINGPQNHHVGIVVGPGLMIDAPHTGAYVELVSYFRPDLVPTGVRP